MASHSSPITPPAMASPSRTPELLARTTERILTVREVAAELRCSKAHVHNLIAGKVSGVTVLPSLRIGRRRIVRRVSFEQWMQTNEHYL